MDEDVAVGSAEEDEEAGASDAGAFLKNEKSDAWPLGGGALFFEFDMIF